MAKDAPADTVMDEPFAQYQKAISMDGPAQFILAYMMIMVISFRYVKSLDLQKISKLNFVITLTNGICVH